VRRIPVDSSTLAAVRYLPSSRELEVTFRSGQIYRYLDIPIRVYRELLAAESKGTYYNFNIRNRFSFQQLVKSSSARTGAR
jgi:hypothetical protein